MTQPSTTKVLALPARSEQYGLFLTPYDWTILMALPNESRAPVRTWVYWQGPSPYPSSDKEGLRCNK